MRIEKQQPLYMFTLSFPAHNVLQFTSDAKLSTLPVTLQTFFINLPVDTFAILTSPRLFPVCNRSISIKDIEFTQLETYYNN